MTLREWVEPVDDAGTWECRHVDTEGHSAPSTRLSVAAAIDLNAGHVSSTRRASLYCPDCGTYWRVWEDLRTAKYYVTYRCQQAPTLSCPSRPGYRRAVVRDIDRILDAVSPLFPDLIFSQYEYVYPGDDDGIWWFGRPGHISALQIESWAGMCPFRIETDEQCCADARTTMTVEDTVRLIVTHLAELVSPPG